MAEHRQDGGLHRSEFVLGPAARMSPAECPAERTQRSSGRGPREWSRESGAVETRSGGSGHRGPRSRDAGFVGRERLVVRTGCPRIPPAGTFSPHGVEKDPIQASARPLNGSFPITPQRQQPRVPPLPRIDSRQTEPPRPREKAGVRAEGPRGSCCLSRFSDLSLHSLRLHSLGLGPRGEGERAAWFFRLTHQVHAKRVVLAVAGSLFARFSPHSHPPLNPRPHRPRVGR